jgi:hypothetical protein
MGVGQNVADFHKRDRVVAEAVFPMLLAVPLRDLGTAGQVYVTIPYACKVARIDSVTGIDTDGAVTLTVKDGDGNSMGTIAIASGGGVGDQDALVPTANNIIAANEAIEIETDAGGTVGATMLTITLEEGS